MNLRFNEGAIIKFTLYGCSIPTKIVGKVVKVLPDEVELYSQLRVYRNTGDKFPDLDLFTTADVKNTKHISRHLIQDWTYAKVSDLSSNVGGIYENNLHLKRTTPDAKLFEEYTLNHYDSDGFCKGNGPYCGDVRTTLPGVIFTVPSVMKEGQEFNLD